MGEQRCHALALPLPLPSPPSPSQTPQPSTPPHKPHNPKPLTPPPKQSPHPYNPPNARTSDQAGAEGHSAHRQERLAGAEQAAQAHLPGQGLCVCVWGGGLWGCGGCGGWGLGEGGRRWWSSGLAVWGPLRAVPPPNPLTPPLPLSHPSPLSPLLRPLPPNHPNTAAPQPPHHPQQVTPTHAAVYLSFYLEASNRDQFMGIKQDLLLAFVDCVERNGAKLATPRTTARPLFVFGCLVGRRGAAGRSWPRRARRHVVCVCVCDVCWGGEGRGRGAQRRASAGAAHGAAFVF